jgi:aspartyl protease
MKDKTGGGRWDSVVALSAEGEKASFGLTGRFHQFEDLSSGLFEAAAEYSIFSNAEGFDSAGRWRQDNSGGVHPLDSDDAQAVAVSESYLARRGYFFPDRAPALFQALESQVEGGKHFNRMAVTPQHGRTIEMWFDDSTSLLDRAVIELSVGSKIIRFSDYRVAGEFTLPFTISIEHRDENETGTARIREYQIIRTAGSRNVTRPASRTSDAEITGNLSAGIAKGYLDPRSGFFIVDASINGKGPFPFILDTGGHDILTPKAARELGLRTLGGGMSTGAGSGTTPTEFTKVDSLAIGPARMSAQPFTVLHLDLGSVKEDRRERPIAGILGLEFFERFAVTIDYAVQTVSLYPIAQFTYAGKGTETPIRFSSDMPLILAKLEGRAGWFAVDTGNNQRLILFHHWAESNGLGALYSNTQKTDASSVGGNLELRMARAKSFVIGPSELTDIEIMLAGENAGSLSARFEAGNLGNSILSNFRVTFNYGTGSMFLEPRAN